MRLSILQALAPLCTYTVLNKLPVMVCIVTGPVDNAAKFILLPVDSPLSIRIFPDRGIWTVRMLFYPVSPCRCHNMNNCFHPFTVDILIKKKCFNLLILLLQLEVRWLFSGFWQSCHNTELLLNSSKLTTIKQSMFTAPWNPRPISFMDLKPMTNKQVFTFYYEY